MTRRFSSRAVVCMALCLFVPAGQGAEVEPPLPQRLDLFVGETRVLAAAPKRMAVGNGQVLSVTVVDDRQLLLLAEAPGLTVLHLWLRDGREARITVQVAAGNLDATLASVNELLEGADGVAARASGGRIVLEGEGLSAVARERAAAVAALFPGLVINFVDRLGADATVQIDARIVEFRRSTLRDLGVRWRSDINGPNAGVLADLIVSEDYRPASPDPSAPAVSSSRERIWPPRGYLGLSTTLDSRLRLLEQQGDVAVIAEPSLSCRSGGAARFVAGGEIPITAINSQGSADVEFKEYGVILDVKPVIDGAGGIVARVEVEISQIDESQRVLGVPGFLKRRTVTDIRLLDGETLVLAGLVSRLDARDRSAVPGLGRVPVAGRAFRADLRRRDGTELVIFLTPRVRRGADVSGQALSETVERRLEEAR